MWWVIQEIMLLNPEHGGTAGAHKLQLWWRLRIFSLKHRQQPAFRLLFVVTHFQAIRQRGHRGYSTGRWKKRRRTGGTDPLTGRTGATVPASFLPSTGTKTLADSHLRFIPLLPQLLLFIALWKTNTSFLVSEIRDENHQQFLSTYRSIFDKRGHAHPFSMN